MGFISSIIGTIANGFVGLANRSLGIFDFGLGLFGIRPKKKLRLRVLVLRTENGSPLATRNQVVANINYAVSIYKEQANVEIIGVDGDIIRFYDYSAPTAALDVGCDLDAWREHVGEAGDFFSLNSAVIPIRSQTGYGSPITAFIVRDVKGKDGCALGPLVDYVTVDTDGLEGPEPSGNDDVSLLFYPSKILAHEVAHACGLAHRSGRTTLMNPDNTTGIRLTTFQKSWLRNSRHVTYF